MIGETVGNYRVTELLSKGGMGAVYIAEHVNIGRKAAVKVLLPAFSDRPDSLHRFFDEARATAAIGHPGIVDIFDYGRLENGNAYLIMELLEGDPLTRRLYDPMPVARALVLMEHITSALLVAHAKGIVHRDLKPANIILVADPAVRFGERTKLLDFGIAKLADEDFVKDYTTRTGTIMGTPAYMAPEQCRGAGEVDQRADLYSLGCILFHMLCARPPFAGHGAGEIIGMQQFVPPPRPSDIIPDIPSEVEALVLRLLEKDPEARVQSAAALLAELADVTPSAAGPDADGWSVQARHHRAASPVLRRLHGTGGPDTLAGASEEMLTGSLPENAGTDSHAPDTPGPTLATRKRRATSAPSGQPEHRGQPAPGGDSPNTLSSAVNTAESVVAPAAPSQRWRRYAAGLMLVSGLGLGGWMAMMQRADGQRETRAGGEPGDVDPTALASAIAAVDPAPGPVAASGTPGSGQGERDGSNRTGAAAPATQAGAVEPATQAGAAGPATQDQPASAAPAAAVTITSEPGNASVYLGQKKLGETPIADYVLPEASREIVLVVKKGGYREQKVRVQPGATLHVVLEADRTARKTSAGSGGSSGTARPTGSQPPQTPPNPGDTINPYND